jgi:uncharacterized membrane protein
MPVKIMTPKKKKLRPSHADDAEVPVVQVNAPEDDEIDVEDDEGVYEDEEMGVAGYDRNNPSNQIQDEDEEGAEVLIESDDDVVGESGANDTAPGGDAAAPPPPALTEMERRRQEMAVITTNWGSDFGTLRDCIPGATWCKGTTKHLTEESCEVDTLSKFRELSGKTQNKGKIMREQIGFRWRKREKRGEVGDNEAIKQRNLREDLQLLIDGDMMEEKDIPKKKGRTPSVPDSRTSAAKRMKRRETDPSQPPQDDQDSSSSDSDSIPPNDPAVAPTSKRRGKQKASEATSNDPETRRLTRGQRDLLLGQIYVNWDIDSLFYFLPALLLPPDINDDSLIDGRILTRLRHLSDVTAGQGIFVQEAMRSEMNDMHTESTEQVLELLARVRDQIHATTRALDRASAEARARAAAAGSSRGVLGPTLGVAGPSGSSSVRNTVPQPILQTVQDVARLHSAADPSIGAVGLAGNTFPPQAPTQQDERPGLSRPENRVPASEAGWALRHALDEQRQSDQRVDTARRRLESAVLHGQSARDQAALSLAVETAREAQEVAHARTNQLQGFRRRVRPGRNLGDGADQREDPEHMEDAEGNSGEGNRNGKDKGKGKKPQKK